MKIQTATNGMTLTNGESYTKTVYLPDDAAFWPEIPDSEVPTVEEEKEEMDTELEVLPNQVPKKISKLQLKIQLVKMGFDLQIIENAINALPEPQKTFASLSWTEATNFYRDNDMIASVGQMLKLTSEQIDELFIEANKIRL